MIRMLKYPKLLLLILSFAAAYVLFERGFFEELAMSLNGHGYRSAFLGGVLFSFGFTAAFGVGILAAIASHVHPLFAAPLAGIGALLSDYIIFSIVRFSVFHDELHRLKANRFMQWLISLFHHERFSERFRRTLLWSFAGIIIASPLPDEFGVLMVSSISSVRPREFSILCFLLNTIGIFLVLLAARAA